VVHRRRVLPFLALHLTRVASLTVDVARAGLASLRASTINVVTDTAALISLAALAPNVTVLLDGQPTGPVVPVPVGRHTITLTTA
jgi:GTP:adenosylcobinamide-phosphate guanylyltransferase